MLSPWQRAMQARRQAYLRSRAHQEFMEAARRMAQEIANPDRIYYPPPSPPITYNPDVDMPPPGGWDFDLSSDQMYWEAEREMEKWDDFVKDLQKRPKREKGE